MYEDHFGLRERPFQLTPDPKYWFDSATHRKAMAYLGYGLAQGEGFIVITGDIGAGKTTLVGHLTSRIDPANLNVISLVSSAIVADDLLRIVATGLGVADAPRNKAELLTVIERGLNAVARTGRRTLLIVDEAQALDISAVEELRMLSNFQAGGRALLQIFLLGQPEFRERLHGSQALEQPASASSRSTTSIRWARTRSPNMSATGSRSPAGRAAPISRRTPFRCSTASPAACRAG